MISKPPYEPAPPVMVPDAPAAADVAPVSDSDFAEAHRQLLSDGSIQFDLPIYQPDPPQPPPEWLRWLASFLGSEHPVLRVLLWGLLIAAALFIVYLIARRLSGADWPWRRRVEAGKTDEDWRPGEAPARALLSEADTLAAQGRFSEAAHLLLFRSIEDVDSRRPGLLKPAFTSRDIAGLPAIPERPRGAFARIAMLVERSLFARRALAEGDWRDCRAAYEEFAFAEVWRG